MRRCVVQNGSGTKVRAESRSLAAALKVIYPTVSAVEKKLAELGLKENYKKIPNDLKHYHEKHGNT